jgi:hypothetical protein
LVVDVQFTGYRHAQNPVDALASLYNITIE